jgi:FkbM family methyltransferase
LRNVPVLGRFLRHTSRKLVAPDTLLWVQIEVGAAEGLWIRVNPRTGREVLHGEGEEAVQQAIARYLRPGMVFYDLGANIGFFSLIAARLVGHSGRVFSFEADPQVAGRLRENLRRNQFTNASVQQAAVWSGSKTVSFARADSAASADRGLGFVTEDPLPAGEIISVPAVSLDDFCASHPAPHLVKCDVEGAEREVFNGASRLLSVNRPMVICEMHSAKNQECLIGLFRDFGYSCGALDHNHILALPH